MENSKLISAALVTLMVSAGPALAGCYADYKAKRDDPLRLHYGVIEMPNPICKNPSKAKTEVRSRLALHDWKLLNVISVFGDEGLNKRKKSAGKFYLRY